MGTHHDDEIQLGLILRRGLTVTVAVIAVASLVGLAVLWPRGKAPDLGPTTQKYANATVREVTRGLCPSVEENATSECQLVDATVRSGADRGSTASFSIPDTDFAAPTLRSGDKVILFDGGASAGTFRYGYVDFQRGASMWWLVVLFAVVVLVVGRLKGLRALAGLVASLGVLLVFVLPALLRGSSTVGVALVAVVVVAFLALNVAHGVTVATTVALLGTLVSLVVITGLGAVFIAVTRLTGLVADEAQVLRVTATDINLHGLLLAGIVIGALGVLDDVTVTQVSAVAELRAVDPTLSRRALYVRAERIGRDHIASTINTLVLAYAGASLPLLLLFVERGQSFGRVLTSEVIAVEVVRTVVGSIGLVLAVPLTTALAAVVLTADTPEPGRRESGAPPNPADPWERFTPQGKPFS
jgi:uncharacterized membrane protein